MEIENSKNYYGAFIIPHSDNNNQNNNNNQTYIEDTIEGLFSQTEDDWCAIIIVNKSTSKKDKDYLNILKEKHYPKIDVIFLEYDVGPGVCRNLGILKTLGKKISIILFNDSDDMFFVFNFGLKK